MPVESVAVVLLKSRVVCRSWGSFVALVGIACGVGMVCGGRASYYCPPIASLGFPYPGFGFIPCVYAKYHVSSEDKFCASSVLVRGASALVDRRSAMV